ncbi:MAG: hypothetical protein MJZ49_01610 [Bacteroidales bacterium]|nr:hypothetical protein [Bacteroidales bacterium]
MKKVIFVCFTVIAMVLAVSSCENESKVPKSYKVYWDITNFNYEPSDEITNLLHAFDEGIAQGSYGDSIKNHGFIVKDVPYSEYKRIREETTALTDQVDAHLRENWKPTKRYRVRIYCYCEDDYDYYSTNGSSTEVWATYTYKKYSE